MPAVGWVRNAGDRARSHGAGLVARGLVAAVVAGLGWAWLAADAGSQPVLLTDAEPATSAGTAAAGEAGATALAPPTQPRTGAEAPSAGTAPAAAGEAGRLTVVVDGREHDAAARGTVADLLERLDIAVDADDRVTPGRDHRLADGDRVVVEHVERLRREREVAIAAGEREKRTGALPRGQRRTVQEGRAGLVAITEEITRVAGETVDRTELGRETVRAPRPTVIEVGTAEPEPEPNGRVAAARRTTAGSSPSAGSGTAHDHTESADPADPATWDRLAQCETGGDWHADTGNGYYGGLQFSLDTWRALGGTGKPHEHPRETQIEMGRRLHAQQGWAPWPHCARELGYR